MFDKRTIEICMNKKGWTKYRLAKEAGIGQSTLSEILSDKKKNPSINTLQKISIALGVPLDYLTRTSAKAMIEDKLEELNITLEDLSAKTKIPITFFSSLDNIIPDEGDYERIQVIARALNIEPIDLVNALHRQEPPITEENLKEWDEKSNQLKEVALYETGEFETAEAAMQFILKQPAIMGFGGFDIDKMSDEEIIEFANELLNQLKLLSYKYKK